MDFHANSQPAWPFPRKQVYVGSAKPKPQPKAPYQDNFCFAMLPTTSQTLWVDSFWKKVAPIL